jgi:RimJ/RimL family protein N-acetyltransferase
MAPSLPTDAVPAYQIDAHCKALGVEAVQGLRFVCSDMWKPTRHLGIIGLSSKGPLRFERRPVPDDIVLRNVVENDLAILFDQQRDPEASHMAAFVSRDPADWDAFLKHWTRILADPTVTMKVIVWGGQVVGSVGSFEWEGKPQVTYWIAKQHWGKGIATRALVEFLRQVERRPLYASAASDNAASIRVLQKCGFTIYGSTKSYAGARREEIEEVMLQLKA